MSAATAPLRLISAVAIAQSAIVPTTTRVGRPRASATMRPPAQAVIPVDSIPSLTTNIAAMKTTTGSPNPAIASSRVSRLVAYNATEVPTATTPTGKRSQTNNAMTVPRITSAVVASFMRHRFRTTEGQ